MRRAPAMAALALALLPVLGAAEITIIPLHNRSAAELIPVLKPIAPPGVSLSGDGYRLIVRADSPALEELRTTVRRLDRAAPLLRVSVRRNVSGERSRSRVGVEGGSDEGIGVRLGSSTQSRRSDGTRSVQVRAGASAWIDTGGVERIDPRDGGWRRYRLGSGLRRYRQGFTVVPRLIGEDRVRLEIRVSDGEPLDRSGRAANSEIVTTASGRLGEWIELAGVQQRTRQNDRGLLSAGGERSRNENAYRVRVERVD